ncbi:NTP pyrophosphohydrolase [Escherichia coli]
MPDGLSYLLNPVDAGLIPYTALKDGSVDLYDIALLNDHLAVKADNQRRIEKWRARKNCIRSCLICSGIVFLSM